MDILSPNFLANAILDELAEKAGTFRFNADLHRTHFLDGRAIALSADGYGGIPYVMWGRDELWQPDSYPVATGKIFWMRTWKLQAFVDTILPKLQTPIVLVTGEDDSSPIRHTPQAAKALLESDKIYHWFGTQSDIHGAAEKHTPMPLGMPYPYRTDISFGKPWFAPQRHITARYDLKGFDRRLAGLTHDRKPLAKRKLQVYGDFALNNTSRSGALGETRAEVAGILAASGCAVFPRSTVQRLRLYEIYCQYAFVASPFGRGMDCYRTWEALLMGAVPIVRRSPITQVFDGFPVAIIDDWREVTQNRLEDWVNQFSGAWDDGSLEERLTSSYWWQRIKAKSQAI